MILVFLAFILSKTDTEVFRAEVSKTHTNASARKGETK
jgi:hypothetical protein